MLYRLMGWPIFPHSDRIVSEDVDHRNFHQSAQAHRRAFVIAKDQEPRSKRSNFRERQSVEDGPHRMLADPEVQIPSGGILATEISGAFKSQSRFA
jgi:hypothetical protein